MSTFLLSRRARSLAGLTAGAVASAGLVALASAPAQAAPAAPVLKWEISQRFDDHLSSHVLSNGATEDANGVVTFPNGVGRYNPADGSSSVSYEGSVAGSFVFSSVTQYTVTIADPTVTVDAAGNGTITAVVSSWNTAGMGNPEASTSPARVVVTTFAADDADWTTAGGISTLTETPHWAGVVAPGSATDLGLNASQPYEGKSFAKTFLANLTSGTRAHFFKSADANQEVKAPSSFTMEATSAPSVALQTLATSPSAGVTLRVNGAGFNGQTNPGDNGVYIGVAPAGGIPDTSSISNQDQFVVADWVPNAAMPSGTFSRTLTLPTDRLDPAKKYSVYTWQAHTHSNTTQDTETPVTIDWEALKQTPTVAASWKKKPKTTNKKGKLTVTVTGAGTSPTGEVTITLKRKGNPKTKKLTAALVNGTIVVKLPTLKAGKWTVTVAYAGDQRHNTGQDETKVKINKVEPRG